MEKVIESITDEKCYYVGSFKIKKLNNTLLTSKEVIIRDKNTKVGFKSRDLSNSDMISIHFKLSSDFIFLGSCLSLYRSMIEELYDVEIYDFALTSIDYEQFLVKVNISDNESQHHEINDVISDLKWFKKKFKSINVKDFSYENFVLACNKVIFDANHILKSKVLVDDVHNFKYLRFRLIPEAEHIILNEIDLDKYKII